MSETVTLSSKNQVVIPRAAREALRIGAGQKLLVKVLNGCLIMVPEPKDYVSKLEGLHREVWNGMDTDHYLKEERDAWDD